jgi:hypothetical protein
LLHPAKKVLDVSDLEIGKFWILFIVDL